MAGMSKHILYLAAGSGRRFGSNKLLYNWKGKSLYRYGLDMLADLVQRREDCTLTVVSSYLEIREMAAALGARVVDSPESDKGLSFTIKSAIQALDGFAPEDFLLFAVADQPWLGAETVSRLLDAARPGLLAATAAWGDRVGNPTLFSAELIPQLLDLTGDRGGRAVLEACGERCQRIQVDTPRELEDVDTRQALEENGSEA